MSTFVITGSAAGMGRATAELLRAAGHDVVGIDRQDADVVADLSDAAGRQFAIDAVRERCPVLDGVATFAGVGGATGRSAALLASLNYFGTVVLLDAWRPLLAAPGESSVVAISSNATTCQPGWDPELVEACLSGDEQIARKVADTGDSLRAYPGTKVAVARWVRRTAPTPQWAGAGIRLNAVAPGLVETAFVAETRADPVLGQLIGGFPLPLGRGGTAEELAQLVVFLLGPSARFFCGSLLLCDGGTEAQLRPDDWPARWEV
jgi:NAD(P)-dependent dehydrogenase (short-subunit alcohol dehydrogenase family)